jgi:IS5 family transposase
MQPKTAGLDKSDLSCFRLEQIVDLRHPLCCLADKVDWSIFEKGFLKPYIKNVTNYRLPIRLLVGLHYLKLAFNENDATVVARFSENPYWQYFCGFEHFQHELAFDSTDLAKWRKSLDFSAMLSSLTKKTESSEFGRKKSNEFSSCAMPISAASVNPQALLRLPQVLALIPVSRSNWLAGVRAGRYPQPIKLGIRTTC